MNYTFEQRLEALRRRKEEQTQEKIRRNQAAASGDFRIFRQPENE